MCKLRSGSAGEMRRYHYGDLKPFGERAVDHRFFIMSLSLMQGEVDVVMRVQTGSSMRIPLTLWEGRCLLRPRCFQMMLNGLYYGLMLVMALYNAFVYFSIRERAYLVYVCLLRLRR